MDTSFDTYGPWAALVAVSGLVGWGFRMLLMAVLKDFRSSMEAVATTLHAIHEEIRSGNEQLRERLIEFHSDLVTRHRRLSAVVKTRTGAPLPVEP